MYSGKINATGTRYCPSIGGQARPFCGQGAAPDLHRAGGRTTHEMYVQGMSTSLPGEVQIKMLRTMQWLRQLAR